MLQIHAYTELSHFDSFLPFTLKY